jgi:hypothetical protein
LDLLQPRAKKGFGLPEAIIFIGYCLILAWCIPRHESWFDEAQAWLIARDSTLTDLLLHRLHYEGAPALWHLILWLEVRLHISFLGMHYISGLIAAAGIFVWLRFNPLPRIISLLMPFTFFLQYQYAIVARSYCLVPMLVFLLMALYQNRKSNLIVFCVVAGLLINCSLHSAALAAGLIVFYAIDRLQLLRQNAAPVRFRTFAVPAVILLLSFIVSAAVARPTADGSFGNLIVNKIRQADNSVSIQKHFQTNDTPPPFLPPPHQSHTAQVVWNILYPAAGSSPRKMFLATTMKHTLLLLAALTAPIAVSNILALLFLALLAINLSQQHLWASLIPYALALFAFLIVFGASHHLGLLWIGLLCSLWALSLQPVPVGSGGLMRQILYAVTLLIVVLQIGWSAYCLHADFYGSYSDSKATAEFLEEHPVNGCIAAFGPSSIAINAYLNKLPYCNQSHSYWPMSKSLDPGLFVVQEMAQRPAMVVAEENIFDSPFENQWFPVFPPGSPQIDPVDGTRLLVQGGYHETHRFCGEHFFRNAPEFTGCSVIYERSTVAASTAPATAVP